MQQREQLPAKSEDGCMGHPQCSRGIRRIQGLLALQAATAAIQSVISYMLTARILSRK